MAILSHKTIVGNIGSIYEMRTVGKDNREVIDFTVASTPRVRDGEGDWKDGLTVWTSVTAWGKLARNISESFKKGDRVFVYGREEMKAEFKNKNDEVVPSKPIVIAEFAGLEVGMHAATSARVSNGGGNASRSSSNNSSSTKTEKKAAPATKDDDLDIGFDADDDLGF